MLLAAGAGVAVGGVAGALIASHDDSDDEKHTSYAAAPAAAAPAAAAPAAYGADPGYGAAGYGADPGYGAYPPGNSEEAADLRAAERDYQEALHDSSASSSDIEEAREELEEAEEEYYDD